MGWQNCIILTGFRFISYFCRSMSKSKKSNKSSLCDWSKKDIELHLDQLAAWVSNPEFICTKCARAANSKKVLCHPKRFRETANWSFSYSIYDSLTVTGLFRRNQWTTPSISRRSTNSIIFSNSPKERRIIPLRSLSRALAEGSTKYFFCATACKNIVSLISNDCDNNFSISAWC